MIGDRNQSNRPLVLSSEIKYCSLGSGSKGNATLVASEKSLLMIDCGFSTKETLKRLSYKQLEPDQITAILVTHEHSDHIGGVVSFANKYDIPVYLSHGTSLHKKCDKLREELCHIFNSHDSFVLRDLTITPITVPHDAREATQFIFESGTQKLGLLTDTGHITSHIIDSYANCNSLLLEFNYDEQRLWQGPYPEKLKRRVAGNLGHLSNQQAIQFLQACQLEKLSQLVVMHKSEENNCESLINKDLSEIASSSNFDYFIACQKEGFEWQVVSG